MLREFVSPSIGEQLISLANQRLRRISYADGHFDGVISGYRECTISLIGNEAILKSNQKAGDLSKGIENTGCNQMAGNLKRVIEYSDNVQSINLLNRVTQISNCNQKAHILNESVSKDFLNNNQLLNSESSDSTQPSKSQPSLQLETLSALSRTIQLQFNTGSLQPSVHLLDLSPTGHVDWHIDNKEACGSFIAGLSLLSSVQFCLRKKNAELVASVELPPLSLYFQREEIRFELEHSIQRLPHQQQRRIVFLFRSCP